MRYSSSFCVWAASPSGGPIAHLGYFQKELVAQRKWCDEGSFAEIIALAQSLPGPSSSQVCFAMGIVRAGWLGGVAAWTGFTLPSALLMFAFAFGSSLLSGKDGMRLVHGLQLVAVAVVAQAVLTMQRSLAPDRKRISLAIVALAIVLFGLPRLATLFAILFGGVAGVLLFRSRQTAPSQSIQIPVTKGWSAVCLVLLFGLLVSLPIAAHITQMRELQALWAFYRTGALVFGGGHVVLPFAASRSRCARVGKRVQLSLWLRCGTSITWPTVYLGRIPRCLVSGNLASCAALDSLDSLA